MLSAANKPIVLSVIRLCVVMLNVVAPPDKHVSVFYGREDEVINLFCVKFKRFLRNSLCL
jgi:hypothetical protein